MLTTSNEIAILRKMQNRLRRWVAANRPDQNRQAAQQADRLWFVLRRMKLFLERHQQTCPNQPPDEQAAGLVQAIRRDWVVVLKAYNHLTTYPNRTDISSCLQEIDLAIGRIEDQLIDLLDGQVGIPWADRPTDNVAVLRPT